MSDYLKVLILEDLPSDAELEIREVRNVLPSPTIKVVETESEYIEALNLFKPNLIISDYTLPAFDGLSALKIKNDVLSNIPFIIVTGSMDEDTAVDCLKAGADDYVIKEHIRRLGPAILSALEKKENNQKRVQAEQEKEVLFQAMKERLKEMGLLFAISHQSTKLQQTLREFMQYVADHIPSAWQYPEITCARITLGNDQISSRNFKTSEWVQSSSIKVNGGKAGKIEVFYTEERPAEDIGPFLIEEQHLVESLASLIQNFTERKQTGEALAESEEKYRSLIQHSNDGIYLLFDRKFEIVNSEFLKMFGYTAEDLNSPEFDFINIVASKSRHAISLRDNLVNKGEIVPTKYEFSAITKTGDEIEVETSVTYLKYKNGIATQGIIRDISERKKRQEVLMQTIIEVQENEKNKFGQELHDGLGQILSSASMYIESLRKTRENLPVDYQNDLDKIIQLNKQAINDTRRISHGLMITGIEEKGLSQLIKEMCNNANTKKLLCDYSDETFHEHRLKNDVKIHIYRIIQELITNIIRHSNATKAKIELIEKDEDLIIKVADNGKGFSINDVRKGAGILNIKKRVIILNGIFDIISAKNKGTKIKVSIPL